MLKKKNVFGRRVKKCFTIFEKNDVFINRNNPNNCLLIVYELNSNLIFLNVVYWNEIKNGIMFIGSQEDKKFLFHLKIFKESL